MAAMSWLVTKPRQGVEAQRGKAMRTAFDCRHALGAVFVVAACWAAAAPSRAAGGDPSANLGPYNVRILEGGIGVTRPLAEDSPLLAAGTPWSMSGWMSFNRLSSAPVVIAAIGDVSSAAWRGLELRDGKLYLVLAPLRAAPDTLLLGTDHWYAIAATFDGSIARLYVDGREVAATPASTAPVAPRLELAPQGSAHFGGALALFSIAPTALSPAAVRALADSQPDFSLL